jgi:hypothetical protein
MGDLRVKNDDLGIMSYELLVKSYELLVKSYELGFCIRKSHRLIQQFNSPGLHSSFIIQNSSFKKLAPVSKRPFRILHTTSQNP